MPKPRNQIYYAHALCLYDHPLEHEHLRCIRAAFPSHEIINPGAPEYDKHPEMRAGAMGFCLRLIDGAEGVVFSRLLGQITAGVGAEVNHALQSGKEVFELQEDAAHWRLERVTEPVTYISIADTRALYRDFRSR